MYAGYDFGNKKYNITMLKYWPRPGGNVEGPFGKRMVGTTFEVSDDGISWRTIYTITEIPPEGQCTVVNLPVPVTTSMIRQASIML